MLVSNFLLVWYLICSMYCVPKPIYIGACPHICKKLIPCWLHLQQVSIFIIQKPLSESCWYKILSALALIVNFLIATCAEILQPTELMLFHPCWLTTSPLVQVLTHLSSAQVDFYCILYISDRRPLVLGLVNGGSNSASCFIMWWPLCILIIWFFNRKRLILSYWMDLFFDKAVHRI